MHTLKKNLNLQHVGGSMNTLITKPSFCEDPETLEVEDQNTMIQVVF